MAGMSSQLSDQMTSNPMLNAKLTRLKVQQDVELLSNRVERLRAEERKAKQKVLETKLRGQEIIALQQRNEQIAAAKHLAKQLEEDQRGREVQQVRTSSGGGGEQMRGGSDRVKDAQARVLLRGAHHILAYGVEPH